MNINNIQDFEEGRLYQISSEIYVPCYTKPDNNKILRCHNFITKSNESKTVLFLRVVYINGNHVIKLEPGKNRAEYLECLYDSKKIYLPFWDLNRICKTQAI